MNNRERINEVNKLTNLPALTRFSWIFWQAFLNLFQLRRERRIQNQAIRFLTRFCEKFLIVFLSTIRFEAKLKGLFLSVLVSVGRSPNCTDLGLESTKVALDEKGFIKVNAQQQTADPTIFAIGDCAGGLLLAHKASREARVAVDVIAGDAATLQNVIIPAVVFTEPEIAWAGLTEAEAQAKGIPVQIAKFPWSASGRAMTFDATDGLTKLVIDPATERILGVGITGHGAGELISEGVLAMEMGATAFDIASAVHPHPTLSETLMEAAEVFYGHSTHMFARKRVE